MNLHSKNKLSHFLHITKKKTIKMKKKVHLKRVVIYSISFVKFINGVVGYK